MVFVAHPIDRDGTSIPLYVQIAESLLDRIETGELRPGDRLPPERDLSDMLEVNRLTVRRALKVLESQGLLLRQQGAGTFVAEPKIERQAAKLVPFTKVMQRRGYMPGAKVITFERRVVETSVASELRLPVSAPVYHIHRLRLINQEPVLLERFTVPVQRFPEFENHDLSTRSLYEIMETEYGVSVVRARQSLEPVIATKYEADLLGVMPGDPLMLEQRLAFDQNGRPVEHGRDLYRGDRFRFVTEIAPLEI